MPTVRTAYGDARQRPLKSRGLARGFARMLSRWEDDGVFDPRLWLRRAPALYKKSRTWLIIFYLATLGYAADLAMQAPDSVWARGWLWPTAEFVGLTVQTIEIQGHRQDSEVALKAAAQVETGMPIFTMDVQAIQERISALPGVKFASVQTLLPNTVRIQVEEREPFALWQRRGELAVVDEAGAIITAQPDNRYVGLPLIVGQGAEKAAPALFAELEKYPELRKRIRALVYVAERRWNLSLEEGIDVKLPEAGINEALADFQRLEREHAMLEKDITMIDLRFSDRVIVRLSDGAAEKRQEQLKQRFGKKPGRPA